MTNPTITRCDAVAGAHPCATPADRTVAWVSNDSDAPTTWDRTFECRYHAQESAAFPGLAYPGMRVAAVAAGIRPTWGAV